MCFFLFGSAVGYNYFLRVFNAIPIKLFDWNFVGSVIQKQFVHNEIIQLLILTF